MKESVAQIGRLVTEAGLTVVVAESCTAGGLAHALTSAPGASRFFLGGVIAYANEVKTSLLGVSEADMRHFGAVSAEIAEAMATGCRRLLGADIAVSITGIAGPDGGTEEKPVGLVFVGLCSAHEATSRRFQFAGSREDVRSAAVHAALRSLHSTVEALIQS